MVIRAGFSTGAFEPVDRLYQYAFEVGIFFPTYFFTFTVFASTLFRCGICHNCFGNCGKCRSCHLLFYACLDTFAVFAGAGVSFETVAPQLITLGRCAFQVTHLCHLLWQLRNFPQLAPAFLRLAGYFAIRFSGA
jgi:hypothetical protein